MSGYTIALEMLCRTGLRLVLGSAAFAAWPTQASDRASSVRYETDSASNKEFTIDCCLLTIFVIKK